MTQERTMTGEDLERLCINTIRFLSVDAVERARSGHPGAPMGLAPLGFVLWDRFLKHNPQDPSWPDRDRFILSNGHASALLYSLLHLVGYDLPLDELKNFRQWGSKTPGHPEYRLTPGVELTTGPLGQGFANGVGMAIAERWLAATYNRPGHEIIDHRTYAIVSDGDLMEGVASEAASLAGTLRLGKLIYLYDDNDISIEGGTDITFTENVGQRFDAYGWQVIGPIDGMDPAAVDAALRSAQADDTRPSLIICGTVIGFGSPNKAGTGGVHGEPLGAEEAVLAKQTLGWDYPEPFTVPEEALAHFRKALDRAGLGSRNGRLGWKPTEGPIRKRPADWRKPGVGICRKAGTGACRSSTQPGANPVATRDASGRVMNAIVERVHSLMGGSADLAPSTKTLLLNRGDYGPQDYAAPNFHFGVREHAMGSVANGMALHGGVLPYTATFLIFADYMRPAIRLGALMGLRVVYLFTHDSVGLGQDGPTHQPIEQLLGLRAVPNVVVLRPADATETVEAWKIAVERQDGPCVLALTRQNLPVLDRSELAPASGVRRGGYLLWQATEDPRLF